MPSTYTPIATQTLGSAAASVTFSSIPSTYTDLICLINGSTVTTSAYIYAQYNNDTSTNYSWTSLIGDGSGVASQRGSTTSVIRLSSNANGSTANWIMNVMNYSNATTYKTSVSRFGFGGSPGGAETFVGLWRSTSAVNRIDFASSSGNIAAGSTFTLYGVKSA